MNLELRLLKLVENLLRTLIAVKVILDLLFFFSFECYLINAVFYFNNLLLFQQEKMMYVMEYYADFLVIMASKRVMMVAPFVDVAILVMILYVFLHLNCT